MGRGIGQDTFTRKNRSGMRETAARGRVVATPARIAAGALALIAALGAVGCAKHESGQTGAVVESGTTQAVVAAQPGGAATPATAQPGAQAAAADSSDGCDDESADSLPPEVAAFAPDSAVAPGEAIEVTAQASGDVESMALADGLGRATPFQYDVVGKVWRAYYRVPMRSHADPLALSVTAKNGAGRWRRVWAFVKVQSPEAAADTSR